MNEKPSTILTCSFSECLQFLEALGIRLNDAVRPSSTASSGQEQKAMLFTEEQIGILVQTLHDQVVLPNPGVLIGKRVRFEFDSVDEIPFHIPLRLQECLWALPRYLSAFFPQAILEYFEYKEVVGYKLIRSPYPAPYQQLFNETLAAIILNFLRFLVGENIRPEYIAFNYPRPHQIGNYSEFFNCPMYFDRNQFEFVVDRKMANAPIVLSKQSATHPSDACSVQSVFPLQLYSLSRRIQGIIKQNKDEMPSEAHVAESLQVSTRTLRRRLYQSNTNFQKELNFYRRDLAFKYLLSQSDNITDVALKLGFTDSSAFSKAFRKWSGISPRDFKKRFSTHSAQTTKS